MIIIKFMGGLGNQMFQYALYRKLQMDGKKVKADLSWYNNCKVNREFQLLKFPKIDIYPANMIQLIPYSTKFFRKLSLYNLNYFTRKKVYHVDEESCFQRNILSLNKGYFMGYWQSEKYFENIRTELIERFAFPELKGRENLKLADKINNTCSVSIHIRRGDYMTDENRKVFGDICTELYYRRAIKYFEEKYKDVYFFAFSNDKEWVKKNINAKHLVISETNDEMNGMSDMHLMTQCKHNIIANSSFSWWGAWLNQNESQEVIAPNRWLNTKDIRDIWCKGWKRING